MATPPLQTYGKCFESVECYSGAESKPASGVSRETGLVLQLPYLDEDRLVQRYSRFSRSLPRPQRFFPALQEAA